MLPDIDAIKDKGTTEGKRRESLKLGGQLQR